MNKVFECIIDDGKNVFKTETIARNKKELLSIYGGNGEFVSIKDITKQRPISISFLRKTLMKTGYGRTEQELILDAVKQTCLIVEENKEE